MHTSAKLLAAAANHDLSAYTSRAACGRQRVFILGRVILDNILEFERALMEHSMGAGTLSVGLIRALYTSCFRVLRRMRIPQPFYNFIVVLHTNLSTIVRPCACTEAFSPKHRVRFQSLFGIHSHCASAQLKSAKTSFGIHMLSQCLEGSVLYVRLFLRPETRARLPAGNQPQKRPD